MAYMTKKQRSRRFIIPSIILIGMSLLAAYKLDIGKPYMVKITVYDKSDKIYMITSDCIKNKLDNGANDGRKFIARLAGVDSRLKDVEAEYSCKTDNPL